MESTCYYDHFETTNVESKNTTPSVLMIITQLGSTLQNIPNLAYEF